MEMLAELIALQEYGYITLDELLDAVVEDLEHE